MVNTTFDGATGADDADPGDGVCETAAGNNVCTLRAAIEEANAYSSAHGGASNGIRFNIPTTDPNFNGIFWTINLVVALPDLSTDMSMSGPGPKRLTVKRNTTDFYRIFTVTDAGTVTISRMTITNGNVGAGGVAGNISNAGGTLNLTNCIISGGFAKNAGAVSNGGTITFTNCILSGNTAGNLGGALQAGGTVNFINCTLNDNHSVSGGGGGAIHNFGTLNLTNSTLTGNSADGTGSSGGAIYSPSGVANITNSTITGNTAANGGGISSGVSTTNIKSTIVALNTATTLGPDLNGMFTPQGFNFIGKNDGATASFPAGNPNGNNDIVGTSASPRDPMLDPNGLQNNGGPTMTIALLAGSAAIDKGTSNASTGPLTTDQRGPGYTRAVNTGIPNAAGSDGTDVGAFEFGVTISLVSIERSGNDIVVTFQGSAGATYRLEDRNLSDPNSTWQSISGVNDLTPNSSGPASITDPNAIGLGRDTYRVRLL